LFGDSIFDNQAYVPKGEPIIEQLRSRLPKGCRATLLAVDGAVTCSVSRQLTKLPMDASHLIVSVGGNDALEHSDVLNHSTRSAMECFSELAEIQYEFAREYREMLRVIRTPHKPTLVCTIYDAIPGLPREAVTALSVFNDAIIRAAVEFGLPVLDLRIICDSSKDYSDISPIEPSEAGGSKIARAILRILQSHDFSRTGTTIYH
jgi:hypothetical protein